MGSMKARGIALTPSAAWSPAVPEPAERVALVLSSLHGHKVSACWARGCTGPPLGHWDKGVLGDSWSIILGIG